MIVLLQTQDPDDPNPEHPLSHGGRKGEQLETIRGHSRSYQSVFPSVRPQKVNILFMVFIYEINLLSMVIFTFILAKICLEIPVRNLL